MSKLTSLRKPDLVELAKLVGVSDAGTKSDIEGRIAQAFENPDNTTLVENTRFASYASGPSSPSSRKPRARKPAASFAGEIISFDGEPVAAVIAEEDGQPQEEDEEEELDEEEIAQDSAAKLLALYESAKDKALLFYDDAADLVEEYVGNVKQVLSTPWILAFGGYFLELVLIVTLLLPEESIFSVQFTKESLTEKYAPLFNFKLFWEPLLYYSFYTIALPLVASFFTNFTSGDSFDPLVFYFARALTVYVLFESKLTGLPFIPVSTLFTLDRNFGVAKLAVGILPYVGSVVGAVFAQYAANSVLIFPSDDFDGEDYLEDFEFEEGDDEDEE